MNSDDPYQNVPVSNLGSPSANGRSGRGCFFYGCLFSVIGFLLMIGGGGLMVYLGVQQLVTAVASIAEDAPRKFPAVPAATAEELAALEKRIDDYSEAMQTDNPPKQPLELSELEVNQLINGKPELNGLVYIDFEPDLIKGEVSIPLDRITTQLKRLRGKYLNGEAEMTAEITSQGFLDVHLKRLKAGSGKELDGNIMMQLGKENLAKDLNSDPKIVGLLKKIAKLEILKDKVRLVPKNADAANQPERSQIPPEKDFNNAVDEFREGVGTTPAKNE
jgi:hypothetical protein